MIQSSFPRPPLFAIERLRAGFLMRHEVVEVETRHCLEFVDLTDRVTEAVRSSGIANGIVNVQTRHTTTGVCVNENEPLLLDDLKRLLERLGPRDIAYAHDDFTIRTVNMCPDEERNGHSHAKALFLRASETLNVIDGALDLGCWQRIFLIELDRGRRRRVSIMCPELSYDAQRRVSAPAPDSLFVIHSESPIPKDRQLLLS